MRLLTKSELINMNSNEISKRIKTELSKNYPECKFSVTQKSFSGGFSISIALMKADKRIKRTMGEISEKAIWKCANNRYTKEQIEKEQTVNTYHQLNHFNLRNEFKPDKWCNGVFLTEYGHKLLRDAVLTADQFNWDESDPMTDYFNVNFYLHIELGKWNKPFEDAPCG